jgi:hypothetical protein
LQRQGGRPIKKVPKGERTQIGVIVGGNTKARLVKAMQQSGRTISREVEHLIEKALAYDDMLRAMSTEQLWLRFTAFTVHVNTELSHIEAGLKRVEQRLNEIQQRRTEHVDQW